MSGSPGGAALAEIRPTVGKRVQALALGLVPGLAHIAVLDRPGAGTVLFLLFVAAVDTALAGLYLVEEPLADRLYAAGGAAAGVVWLAAWLDMARLAFFRDYEKRAALRETLVAEGVKAYAAGDLPGARRAFRGCLSLDHRDADVLFWYGCVEARLGKVKRARRAFRRCRKYDLARKWEFPIGEQERALTAAPPA